MLPTSPHRERSATLASLCLVNRLFLHIARPLLYHTVRLDPTFDLRFLDSDCSKLAQTLFCNMHCAGEVKKLRLVLEQHDKYTDWNLLRVILRKFTRLETISTSWDSNEGFLDDSAGLWAAIEAAAPQIKHLETPLVKLNYPASSSVRTRFKSLETLVIRPSSIILDKASECKLRHVVFSNRIPRAAIELYLASAHETLTSLSFQVTYEDSIMLDLSNFPNLSTLNLVLGDFHSHNSLPDRLIEHERQCIETVQALILSSHSLTLRTLSLATKLDSTAASLSDYPILNLLPPTLQHLSAVPELLGEKNIPLLFPNRKRKPYPCPSLSRITILPSIYTDDLDEWDIDEMATTQTRLSELCEEQKLSIEVVLRVNLGDEYGAAEAFNSSTDGSSMTYNE